MKQLDVKKFCKLPANVTPEHLLDFTELKSRVHSRYSGPGDLTRYLNVTLTPLQEPRAAKSDIPVRG